MPNFCVKCGAPLSSGPFCVKCGADMRNTAEPPQPQGPQPMAQTPLPQAAPSPSSVPAKQGMSSLAKLGIAAVVIVFVGGAAGVVGVYYVVHRVSQKVHQAEDRILESSSTPGDSRSGADSAGTRNDNSMGDVCRFLSKEDVSKAIGVTIVRTHSEDTGCNYFAKGTQAEMSAKHAAAMAGDQGADKKTQQIAEQFASGVFQMTQADKPPSAQDSSGEVPVFNFSLDQNAAEEQIRLNAKVLGNLGPQQSLPGIGDQGFVTADGMIMVRKGKTLIRILYLTCPCGVDQVKPLAKEIADAL